RRSRRPVVDLPQPLSPTSASVSPRATVKLRSSTALTAPRLRPKKPDLTWKCLTSFSTRSSGPSVLAIDAGAAARALIGARLGRVDSLPPCGGGSGWGVVPRGTAVPLGSTPTPDPSPQDGGGAPAAPRPLPHTRGARPPPLPAAPLTARSPGAAPASRRRSAPA